MHARIAITLSFVILLVIAGRSWAAGPSNCTAQPCTYLPLVRKPPSNAPEPATATATATHAPSATPSNTVTPSVSLTPTVTRTPGNTPTASPSATSTPTLPPASFVDCGTKPNSTNTANWPIQIVTIDKEHEQVILFNRSPDTIDLTGWHMCSITGGQQHPISGLLGPFTVQTYTNTGGPIWNNSSPDPGALYNPAGQLVSYLDS